MEILVPSVEFVGTLVTLLGLVVVAPTEAGQFIPSVGRWLIRRGFGAWSWIERKVLRRPPNVNRFAGPRTLPESGGMPFTAPMPV